MAAKSSEWRPGPNVCRCCFAEGCYKDISTEYFWMGKREVYSEMLTDTFDVSIAYSQSSGPNSNSRLICEPCISRLRDASDFKRQVIECEKTFMQHLDPGAPGLLDVEVHVEPVEPEVKLERVKMERKPSEDDFDDRVAFADDDDDDDDLDDQPLTKLASKMPKKESVDILDLFDNAKAEKRKSSTKVKASPSKKPKKKEVVKPSASKPPSKAAPKPEKKKKDENQDMEVDAVRQNAKAILQHSTAYPFHTSRQCYRCCFCTSRFDDPYLFRQHMNSVHQNVDKTVALNLPKKALLRVDITDLRCKCSLIIYSDLKDLATHLKNEHRLDIDLSQCLGLVPLKLVKDHFACLICSKTVRSFIELSRHTGTHFCRNTCDICKRQFESLSGLSDHMLLHHSASRFLCLSCKKDFPTAEARKLHRRTYEPCMPAGCNICKKRFTCAEHKEKHLVEVHGEPEKVHRCTECDEVFKTRNKSYLHFKAAHTDDLKCQYCKKKFALRNDLRAHISRQHTGEKPYKCELCDKAFVYSDECRIHTRTHDDSKKFPCPACDRKFIVRPRLKQHVQKHHPDIYEQEFPAKPAL